MRYDEAAEVLRLAKLCGVWDSFLIPASNYLKSGDLDGFEAVCRANCNMLMKNKIAYTLTDGICRLFYNSGILACEASSINGTLDGRLRMWNEIDNMMVDEILKNGKLDGVSRRFYQNGRLASEETYKNGNLHGISRCFNFDGSVASERVFNDGTLVEEILVND